MKRLQNLFWIKLQPLFEKYPVEIFADDKAYKLLNGYQHLQHAAPEDFDREFLSLKCAVKIVKNIDEALTHIAEYSTKHSEAIVSENKKNCERFLREVDAAAVYAMLLHVLLMVKNLGWVQRSASPHKNCMPGGLSHWKN